VFVVNGDSDQIFTNVGNSSGTFVLHPRQLTSADARMAAAGKFSIDDRVDVAVSELDGRDSVELVRGGPL